MAIIIGITGEVAAGKSTLSEYVRQKYGFEVYEIGDYVRKAYDKQYLKKTLLDFADDYFFRHQNY